MSSSTTSSGGTLLTSLGGSTDGDAAASTYMYSDNDEEDGDDEVFYQQQTSSPSSDCDFSSQSKTQNGAFESQRDVLLKRTQPSAAVELQPTIPTISPHQYQHHYNANEIPTIVWKKLVVKKQGRRPLLVEIWSIWLM